MTPHDKSSRVRARRSQIRRLPLYVQNAYAANAAHAFWTTTLTRHAVGTPAMFVPAVSATHLAPVIGT